MVYLGDYLGKIMSEVTKARMEADIEAVRIAELYASHPLLKKMPVPRFRLPSVEFDIPVLIKDAKDSETDDSSSGSPGIKDLSDSFKASFAKIVEEEKIRISGDLLNRINEKAELEIKSGFGTSRIPIGEARLAKNLTTSSIEMIKKFGRVSEEKLKILKSRLEEMSTEQFRDLRKPASRLGVFVTASELKEIGTKENTTVVRLKINEEAYEWTSIETEDGTKDQLVIE